MTNEPIVYDVKFEANAEDGGYYIVVDGKHVGTLNLTPEDWWQDDNGDEWKTLEEAKTAITAEIQEYGK